MNNKVVPLLVILLMVASFLAGSYWTRTRLESEKKVAQVMPTPTVVAQREEQPAPAVLEAEARAEIEEGGTAVKGDENAAVTMVEFSEYLCSFCAEYVGFDAIPSRPIDEEKTYRQIIEKYVEIGKVRYVFRDYPVHGERAKEMAEAAYCAGDQEEYWQYHDLLFERQKELNDATNLEDLLKELASELDLDTDAFVSCLAEDKFAQAVEDNYQLGKEIGVEGTPTFFINGQTLIGAQPFESFKAVIEQELK